MDLFAGLKNRNSCTENPAPHCTNPECSNFHRTEYSDISWRQRFGSYKTKAFGTVPRYLCKQCGTTFSNQSFSMDYYVKQPVDYVPLIQYLTSTSGQGNMTRFTGMRYELIQKRGIFRSAIRIE